MQISWVDAIIVAVAVYYIFEGWEVGVVRLGTSLVSFLISLGLSIRYHAAVGSFLTAKFGVPGLWALVLGYVIVAVVSEFLVAQVLAALLTKLPQNFVKLKINKLLGAVLSAANALVIMAFVLLVILALPLRGTAKTDIAASYLGSRIVGLVDRYGGDFKSGLTSATQQAVKFLTVAPASDEKIDLSFDPAKLDLKVDSVAEAQMLQLVNAERAKAGIPPVKVDPQIVAVARDHSKDMFLRSYFSHVNPDRHDPGYRLEHGGVNYTFAGENLAYAPDVQTAHVGLMNSEGHRKNILEPKFGRIGIGVIDGGVYGMMFTQDFAD